MYKHLLCVEENKENTEQVVAQEGETVTKETVDIYEAQGYVAEEFIEEREYNEEERGYFDSGYMTLPDEDPDEDKTKFLYPENYKEIADMFNISIHTVISHRRNITRKTGIKTVAGLTVYAILNNLIDPSSVE